MRGKVLRWCLEVWHAVVQVLPAGKRGEALGALEGSLDDDERRQRLVREVLHNLGYQLKLALI